MNSRLIDTNTNEADITVATGGAIPLWEKYSLNFTEAAAYFGIGERRLRLLVSSNPNADFILTIGTHVKIKRQKFIEYLDLADAI